MFKVIMTDLGFWDLGWSLLYLIKKAAQFGDC
jgi:hypothetical protein